MERHWRNVEIIKGEGAEKFRSFLKAKKSNTNRVDALTTFTSKSIVIKKRKWILIISCIILQHESRKEILCRET